MSPPVAEALAASASQTTEPGLRLGPFDVHPSITAGMVHDSNIELSETNRLAAYIGTISPELEAEVGNRAEGGGTWLALNYRPTFLIFSDYTSNNAVDQLASLHALWTGAKLTLGVSQEYSQTHGAVVEIGQRVRQNEYNTDLLAKYAFSDKTSFELGPRLTIQDSANFVNTQDWGLDAFLNHALTAKLTGGVGGSVGYDSIENSPDQRYARGLARLVYNLATKVNVSVDGGFEVREYTSDQPTSVQPVFGVSGMYRPTDTTTVTLEGHRREEASTFTNDQNYVTIGATAEIRQQLWQRYFVSVAGEYDNRSYSATQSGPAAHRTDNYYLIRTSAGATVARNWSINVYNEYQTDFSSAADHSFVDNQVGFEGSWHY